MHGALFFMEEYYGRPFMMLLSFLCSQQLLRGSVWVSVCIVSYISSICSLHSFIRASHFYSASSSPPLLGSALDTARILCRSFKPKRYGQLRVKDLPRVRIRGGSSGIR